MSQLGNSRMTHLNEHKIPDLQYIGIIHVDKISSISASNSVIVDLCTGSTGTLVSHLPEIVLCAERQNALCWQELEPALQQALRSRTSLGCPEARDVTTPDQKPVEGCCSKLRCSSRPAIAGAMQQKLCDSCMYFARQIRTQKLHATQLESASV